MSQAAALAALLAAVSVRLDACARVIPAIPSAASEDSNVTSMLLRLLYSL